MEIPSYRMEAVHSEYNLKWDSHNINALDAVRDAWHTKHHADMMIATDDRRVIPCHKFVVSHMISYFRDVLSNDYADERTLIFVIRAPYHLLNAILQFSYVGEVNIRQADLTGLLKLAKELGVTGLQHAFDEAASTIIIDNKPPPNVLHAAEALQNLHRGSNTYAPRPPVPQLQKQNLPLKYDLNTEVIDDIQHYDDYNQVETVQNLQYADVTQKRKSPPDLQSISPGMPVGKKRMTQHTTMKTESVSPVISYPSPSTSRSPIFAKQEASDSEGSDCELQIDESPMDLQQLSNYSNDEDTYDSEPQDLRVESRQPQVIASVSLPIVGYLPSPMPNYSPRGIMPISTTSFVSRESSNLLPSNSTSQPNIVLATTSSFPSSSFNLPKSSSPNNIVLPKSSSSSSIFLPSSTTPNVITTNSQIKSIIGTSNSSFKSFNRSLSENILPKMENTLKNGYKVIGNKNRLISKGSCVLSHGAIHKKVISPSQVKDKDGVTVHTPKNFKNSEKTYTPETLSAAVELVVSGKSQPVDAIIKNHIPRRTFFRHLKSRRDELGIETKSRSTSNSRATSPEESSNSLIMQLAGVASQHLVRSYQSPASGTHLQEILKNISTAQGSLSTEPDFKPELSVHITDAQENKEPEQKEIKLEENDVHNGIDELAKETYSSQ